MKHRRSACVWRLAAAGLVSACLLPGTTALAQSESEEGLEEIVVTGSRIVRNDLTANSPIAIFDAEQLQLQATTNVEEFLRDMPQFVAGVGSNSNNGNDGSATVDLRNLGESRTLVLVDGKRFVPYDFQGFVDLGMIPASLIERVEVITGGASAVYGSDAVAGVVNFIMKKNFSGIEFDASYGVSNENDASRRDFALTLGGDIAGGRGNVVFNVGFTDQEALTQGDRDYSLFSLDDALQPGGSFTTPWGTLIGNFPSVDTAGAGVVQFARDGSGDIVATTDLFNFNPFNLLQAPQEKWTGTVIADLDINEDFRAYVRGSFANNQINTVIAPSGTFFFPFVVNTNNPFLSAQGQSVLNDFDLAETDPTTAGDGFVNIALGRRLTELGTRDSLYENTAYQFVGGLTGEVGSGYNWELFAQRGRTSRTQNFINDVNYNAALQAIQAVENPDGTISCIDPSGGCAPANFFGENTLSPAAAAFIRLNLNENNKTEQTIYGGSISGDMPFGSAAADSNFAFAVGFELREETGVNLPDQNYSSGNTIGFGSSSPVDAQIEITEFFAEVSLPLLSGSAVGDITLDGGVRVADYDNEVTGVASNSFSNTSWKAGGEWAVNDAIRFRGGFQRAVRAPTLREIGLPRTPSTGDLSSDPCEGTNPVGDADLTALCIATGVPAANIGTVTSIIAGQINNFVGGNATLEPEEADSITFGVVFTPESIPLTVALDYYQIEIENAIQQVSEQNIVNACYENERDPNGRFCSLISRSSLNGSLSGGTTVGVDVSLINAAVREASGIDLAIDYAWEIGEFGSLDFNFTGVHIIKNERQEAEFFRVDDCVGLAGNTCTAPDPEFRFVQNTRWSRGPLTVNLRWQYLSEITNDSIELDGVSPSAFGRPDFGSFSYFDLAALYNLNENLTLRAGIYNLLDKEPPIVGNDYGGTLENSGNTYPATYDPIGRSFTVGINAAF
ncbi:MAG: TonB-dependent receptor [Pseudomonadota bacterium]